VAASERADGQMQLAGFRLSLFPLRSPFYCLECTKAMSDEKGWAWKSGWRRQPAIPVIRTGDGLVRHAQTGRHISKAQGFILDDEIVTDLHLMTEIHQQIAYLGLRLKPSLPVAVAGRIRCKGCGRRLSEETKEPRDD
jgi:hypothetical protein